MSDVFISYARADEPQAKRVADALRDRRLCGLARRRASRAPRLRRRHRGAAEGGRRRSRAVVGRSGEVAMGPRRGRCRAIRRQSDPGLARRQHSAASLQPDPVRGPQRLERRSGLARLAQAHRQRPGARPQGRGREQRASAPPASLRLRAALPEHERRRRAGIFQRRHQRGHHDRPVEDLRPRRDRAQYRLHLQGPVGRRLRRRRASSASATSSKAACARPAGASGSTPS